MNEEEVNVDGILDEELGPDEDDDEAVSAYAANRAKLNASRTLEPNRMQTQYKEGMDAISKIVDPSDPAFISEFMFDMATDASIVLKSDNPAVAARIIAARRLAKRAMKDLPKPNFIKQIEAITSGNLFGLTGGGEGFIDPPPKVRKTPGPIEQELLINRFVNDLHTYVDTYNRKGELVRKHISKIQPNAYKELGKAKAEWNQWAKRTGNIRPLSDKSMTGYVEHLVGKDKFYDLFWELPNHKRFRKGSRHGPNNVRILKDNRMKTFKDTSEGILKRMYPNPTVETLLLFDFDFPPRKGKSIMIDQSPGDLVLKRVDGTVVGRLGDYHDVLYPPYAELKQKLATNINPKTNRPYITTQLPDGTPLPDDDIRAQISIWRSNIIKEKIKFIVDEAPKLKGKGKKARERIMKEAVDQDMVDMLADYPFLEPGKGLRKALKQDIINSPRQKGPFLNKTEERNIRQSKYKGRYTESDFNNDMEDIFGPDE